MYLGRRPTVLGHFSILDDHYNSNIEWVLFGSMTMGFLVLLEW